MKKQIKLLPFEQARYNLEKFAQNFALCETTLMLLESIEKFDELQELDQKDIQLLCESTVRQLSELIESRGAEWN